MQKNFKQETTNWRSRSFRFLCPSEMDWARLAAFIDGEGSILIRRAKSVITGGNHKNETFSLGLMVANTDMRLIQWIQDNFGGSTRNANTEKFYSDRCNRLKTCYQWNTGCLRAAWILFNCLPFFIIKAEQAELGLQLQESLSTSIRRGRKGMTPEIREERLGFKTKLIALKAKGSTTRQEREELEIA